MKDKLLGIAEAAIIGLMILTGAIAVPILCRPFFWWHIEPLELPKIMDLSVSQIKTAYGEMMNYCIGLTDSFSVGVMPFSQDGAAHFGDVRKLFILDLAVLAVAVLLLIGVHILNRGRTVRLAGHTPGFWSAVGLGVAFVSVGGLAAVDFDRAFVVFHKIFFPGKDNWLFDGREDPVIHMLPAEFFRNCAIFILALILLSCLGLLLYDHRHKGSLPKGGC